MGYNSKNLRKNKEESYQMERVHIFNPASGCGHSPSLLDEGVAKKDRHYITKSMKDAEDFAYRTSLEKPDTHFIVYGGDGTVNEVANGILRAGAGSRSLISVVPIGTGNDFVKSFPEKDRIFTVDAIKYNDRYAVNIINFGFDSTVVSKTARYKKVLPGSPAYIAGIADTLLHRIGSNWRISLKDEHGKEEHLGGIFTLALVGNCQWYGGGFRSAPLADPSDGMLDFVAVTKVSRLTFLSMVSAYKKGEHLNPETMAPYPKFDKILVYRRVSEINIEGIKNICADGEIEETDSVKISVVPSALRIAT